MVEDEYEQGGVQLWCAYDVTLKCCRHVIEDQSEQGGLQLWCAYDVMLKCCRHVMEDQSEQGGLQLWCAYDVMLKCCRIVMESHAEQGGLQVLMRTIRYQSQARELQSAKVSRVKTIFWDVKIAKRNEPRCAQHRRPPKHRGQHTLSELSSPKWTEQYRTERDLSRRSLIL